MATPKAVLFYFGAATVEDTLAVDAMLGIGAADGTVQWAFASWADDAVTTVNVKRFSTKNGCILLNNSSVVSRASFVTFVNNGVTINWEVVSGLQRKGIAIFFFGDTLEAQVKYLEGISNTLGKVISPGFTPELLLAVSNFTVAGVAAANFSTLSQGFAYKSGNNIIQRYFSPYSGGNGFLTSNATESGVAAVKHGVLSSPGAVLADLDSASADIPLKTSFSITEMTQESYTIKASNTLGGTIGVGVLALNFRDRAKIGQVTFDLSAQVNGTYTKLHGVAGIEVLEAFLAFPTSLLSTNVSASAGIMAYDGESAGLVVSRGSTTIPSGTYEKSQMSYGTVVYPASNAVDGPLTIAISGFSAGDSGLVYTLSSAPEPNVTFTGLVIGRLEDCVGSWWHQAQLMEPA